MRKKIFSSFLFLASLLLAFQLAFLPTSASALTNNDVLPPSNLSYQLTTPSDIKLTWSSVNGAASYNVYRIVDGTLILVDNTKATSYTFNNVEEGTYDYVVSTISSYGESAPSVLVDINIVYPDMIAPTALTSKVQNGNDLLLSWTASTYAKSYNIYKISPTGDKTLVTSVSATTYLMTNVPEGSYTYEVSAVNPLYGESTLSNPLKVDMVWPTMETPKNLTYSLLNVNDIALKWDSVPYATSYKIYQIVNGEKILKSTVTNTSVGYANMPTDNYVYEVHSYNDRFGESINGSQISFNLTTPTMQAPNNFTYSIVNGNDITLKWAASPYATSYKIYQIVNGEKVFKGTVISTSVTYANMPAGDYSYEIHSNSDRFGESMDGSNLTLNLILPTMQSPNNLSYSLANGNDIALKWTASPYATSYKIYQIVNGQKILKSTVTSTAALYTNMPGGSYSYEVHSYSDRFGESIDGSNISFDLITPVMEAPSNAIQTVLSTSSFSLKWDPSLYATSYKVYQIINGQKVLKNTITGTSITYTNMPAGNYSYVINSYNSRFGESVEGSNITFTLDGQVMDAPTNLTYSINNGNDINLKWSPVQYAASYRVYQLIDGQAVLKATVTSTYANFLNMPAGDYNFIVKSVSKTLAESPIGAEINIPLTLPEMLGPSNLQSTTQNVNDVVLTWMPSTYANSYKIYELINGQLILKTTVIATNVTITGLSEGNHTFVVNSVSSRFGESQSGSEIQVPIVFPVLASPNNLTYSISNGNDIALNWSTVEYATSYKIYQIVDGQKILIQTTTGTSFNVLKAPEGNYNYEVHSYSSRFGESQEGTQLSFAVVYPEMIAPLNANYNIVNGDDITLKWDSFPFATSYKVYQIINGQKVLKQTIPGTTTTFTNMPEGDYTFEIHTYSSRFGESQEGSQLSFALVYPEMIPPSNPTFSIANGNDVILNWESSEYATGYKIYEIIDGQKVLKQTVTGMDGITGTVLTTAKLVNVSEGNHVFEIYSFNSIFGESANGTQLSVSVVFPTMLAPNTVTYKILNGNDLILNWEASQYATGYRIYQVVDGQKILKFTTTTNSLTAINLPEGNYVYEVHSYSTRFGESEDGTQLTFPLVFPTMLAPNTLTYSIANGNDITLNWTSSQYATDYRVYQIINGQRTLIKTLTGNTFKLLNMPAGDYIYEVYSFSNRFGESAIGTKASFSLVWPVIQPPSLSGTISKINNITLSWNSVPWATEYRLYEVIGGTNKLVYSGAALSYNLYNLSEGTHTYRITTYNSRFGESQLSDKLDQTIVYPEIPSPTVTLKLLSDTSAQLSWNFTSYTNGYNIYEIIDGTPVLLVKNLNSLYYTINNLPYANHEYYVTAVSNSFGESDPSNIVTVKLITDVDPPITSVDAPADWTAQSPALITLSPFDKDSGVAATYYSIDDGDFIEGTSFTISEEGIHKVSFYSVDKTGNVESVKTIYVMIDKTAPITTSDAPTTWSKDDVTINLTATDLLSGIFKTFYSIDDSNFIEGTSFTIQTEGIHKVSFYSVDVAGNVESVNTTYVMIDKTAPITTSDAPTTWSKDDVTINLTSTDLLSGTFRTFYSIDDSNFTEGTSFTIQAEGIHKVSFYSVDVAGNVESVNTTYVMIDKTAPITTSDAPTTCSKDDVTINLTATDLLSGIFRTFYSIDDSNFTEGTSFTIQAEGIHKVSFYSVDVAGNVESVKTTYVMIDKTAPITTSNAPTTWTKDDVTINLTSTDLLSGTFRTFYSIDDSNFIEGTSFTIQTEGIHKVSFYSVDVAGNVESVNTIYVKIDRTAPTITMNLGDEYKLGTMLQLNYLGTDLLSGITSEKMVVFKPNDSVGTILGNGSTIELDKPGVYTVMVTVTDAAGNSYTIKKQFTVYLSANIQVTANVINDNNGVITVRLALPTGYSTQGVDLSTATLNGVNALTSNNGYYNQAKNGQFKFRRSDFTWTGSQMVVEFRCYINGYLVVGQTIVKVQK